MASNKKLQAAIRTADSLLLASPSKRLQCLHYTTALRGLVERLVCVYCCQQYILSRYDKKKVQATPSEGSKIPRGRQKKQQQQLPTAAAGDETAAAGPTMVPLHSLPHHIQHSVLESQTVLFQLLKPVDGVRPLLTCNIILLLVSLQRQTSAIPVMANKAAIVSSTSKQPLREQNSQQATAPVIQKPSKRRSKPTPALQHTGTDITQPGANHSNAGSRLSQLSVLSSVKPTNSSLQSRKRTAVDTTKRKPRKTKSATQSTSIKQYFIQAASDTPPLQGRAIHSELHSQNQLTATAEYDPDQVVPTMADGK